MNEQSKHFIAGEAVKDRLTTFRKEHADLKVALVHDWLTGMRGGEKCLEVFCELFPEADLYPLFHFPGTVSPSIENRTIQTSFVQSLPGLRRSYQHFLPFFPQAISRFDLSRYDLVLSSSHCVAKGAGCGRGKPPPHLCYCFTPMRYIWDQEKNYFNRERYSAPALWAIRKILGRLRHWDRSRHPSRYIAISNFVAERIQRIYGRSAEVVYPPVDLDRFSPSRNVDDFYLIVSALVPYKRVDLAVEACTRLNKRLIIVGKGSELERLRARAGPTVEFKGWVDDQQVTQLMSRCRAFILPGEEDFGITPLEAMASGRPVIALGKGGAAETVVSLNAPRGDTPPTGVLYDEPTVERLEAAIVQTETNANEFDPEQLQKHAAKFALPRFKAEAMTAIERFLRDNNTSRNKVGHAEGVGANATRAVSKAPSQ